MVKKLLFLILLFSFGFIQAQSEFLNETWHLKYLMVDGVQYYTPLGENPDLNFSNFNGQLSIGAGGIQNLAFGDIDFIQGQDAFILNPMGVTLTFCDRPNCYFENLYFNDFFTVNASEPKTYNYSYQEYSSDLKSFLLVDANNNRAYYGNKPVTSDPDLFRTWYLYSMEADLGPTGFIADFDPPINPELTINQDMSFSGYGVCNDFSGNFIYGEDFVVDFKLKPEGFIASQNVCDNHNAFEQNYFFDFDYGQALNGIIFRNNNTGELILSLELFPGFVNNYSSQRLSVTKKNLQNAIVFPNPTSDELRIMSPNAIIESISIIDAAGRKIQTIERLSANKWDVSHLTSGVYFLQINSEGKSIYKKFIKK